MLTRSLACYLYKDDPICVAVAVLETMTRELNETTTLMWDGKNSTGANQTNISATGIRILSQMDTARGKYPRRRLLVAH